jgi:hypothetical protein
VCANVFVRLRSHSEIAIDRYIHSDRSLPQNVGTIEEVSAIVRYLHCDRSLPQNAQHTLRGFGDRSLFALRSIAPTECTAQSKRFRRSFAVCTAIDRSHRMHSTI